VTIGVLASGAETVMDDEGRKGPQGALCFSVGGGSYRWVYVPVTKKPVIGGMRIPVGEKGDMRKPFYDLCFADVKTVKRWGVTEPFALVELEVNDGFGSPASESFVATRMRVLDGTTEYPLHVAEVIGQLRKEYQSWLQGQENTIQAGMCEAQRAALGHRRRTGPQQTDELLYVTWLPNTQQLHVQFRTRVRDGAYEYANAEEPGRKGEGREETGKFPRPSLVPRVSAENTRFGKMFGVELGKAYAVSKVGVVEGSQIVPLRLFQKEIPQPALKGPKKRLLGGD
jgi:hypothetical protein